MTIIFNQECQCSQFHLLGSMKIKYMINKVLTNSSFIKEEWHNHHMKIEMIKLFKNQMNL